MRQAKTYEEIKPLIDLCKAGRLFDVQAWISEDKPIELPSPEAGKARKKSPLEVSIELGFHSLVQVLLEGGAAVDEERYSPLRHALWKRRFDIVQLLVEHGADIHSVGMDEVFGTWNNEIVEYFIDRGADLDTDQPLACALCSRIRTALGIFKKYEKKFPSFREQVNAALRYHCKEGNLKWVSLMLWAGGDPYAVGSDAPWGIPDPEEDWTALELAAFYGHFDIFKLKAIQLDPNKPRSYELLRSACWKGNSALLKMLLDKGYDPKDLEDKGSSLIRSLISSMTWYFDSYLFRRWDKDLDTSESREKIKMIHMLVRRGARWEPNDRSDISGVRRSFLKMTPDYIMEFIWIMSEYKACSLDAIEELMRTPSIRAFISKNLDRYYQLKETMYLSLPR